MVMIQEASFKVPRAKNWKKDYIQLDFSTSIKELEDQAKMLRKESEGYIDGDDKGWLTQKWLLMAFVKKCKCDECKKGWKAFEEATK